MIRVVIADDHQLVREGIRALLEKTDDIDVVGEAGDGRKAVALTESLKPDVLVMDIAMPVLNGIQALQKLKARNLETRTVMLSMHAEDILVREAVQHGAKCYLPKGAVSEELLVAIRAAYRGAAYFSPTIADSFIGEGGASSQTKEEAGGPGRLTARERELLDLISMGRTNNEIAKIMAVSVKTVERHRTNLMAKLNARNLVELIRAAVKQRLIQLDD